MTTDVAESDRLRVRLLQTDPELGRVDENVARLGQLVGRGPATDLVVAPELATHGYHLGQVDEPEPLLPTDPRLVDLGRHGSTVVTGFAEAFRHFTYNSAALLSDGEVRIQRKMHLPTYRDWEERKHFRPGGRLTCHDVLGTRMAILICNDLWQPPMAWLAAHNGAEVIVVPTNGSRRMVGIETERTWEVLLLHTAMVLQSYVVFVNRVGSECGYTFWGGSRVVHPSGEVVGQLGTEPGELDCELDLTELRRLRRRWPLLHESRADLIAREATRLAEEEL